MSTVFPLPEEDQPATGANPAAELIRAKIDRMYLLEPPASDTVNDMALVKPLHNSPHQQFIESLTNSGKTMPDIQTEWHEYYSALPDADKHAVWREFYQTHAQASQSLKRASSLAPSSYQPIEYGPSLKPSYKPAGRLIRSNPISRPVMAPRESKHRLLGQVIGKKLKRNHGLRSMAFGLIVGGSVAVVMLFGLFNERFIAPLITPSRTLSNTPIISDSTTAVGSDPKVIIPKINVEIPVVYGQTAVEEAAIQSSLEQGVVHYANTATPGENGNVVIVGHSSNNILNKGKYKFAFVLLNRLEQDDLFMLHKDGKRYTYKVYEKKIVNPNQVEVILPQTKSATATLITCDPPGTSSKRLVVLAEQISPDPTSNLARRQSDVAAAQPETIPGNAPSLWSRLFNWL